jgi:hypothetical protein
MPIGVGDYAQVELNGNWDSAGNLSEGYTQLCDGWWTFSLTPAERHCIRNLLKFDDNLVMLASPEVNSGIFGYRMGQELKNQSNFIEYIQNDSGPSAPSAPSLPEQKPVWLNNGWTYIEDHFDGGVYDSWWNSDYTTDWTLSEMPSGSGDYAGVKGAATKDKLSAAGVTLDNDFDLIGTIRTGLTNVGGNKSIFLRLEHGSNAVCQAGWKGDNEDISWWAVDNSELNFQERNTVAHSFQASDLIHVRITRESGLVKGYYKLNWEDSWTQFAYTFNNSNDLIIYGEGCHEHGFAAFRFQSEDSDFPYS